MMKRRRYLIHVLCVIPAIMCSVAAFADEDGKAVSGPKAIRVGTFDSRLVTTAYVRSKLFEQRLAKMHEELKAAKESGDDKRVKQLEEAGIELQHTIHKQGFSIWPIHDILKTIEHRLPNVAEQAEVDLIVSKWDVAFRRSGIQTIDVTDQIVALFNPSEETLKVIEDLGRKEPVPISQIKRHK